MSVDSILSNVTSSITGAIRQASQSTGISFEYLLTTAKIESNLNPSAQASTSSAKGLYQFIEQTWLGAVKNSGPANGYGNYADAISRSADGRYQVADPTMRTAIMKLRSDPAASAVMAGSFTRANAQQLQSAIGRSPTDGELYIAHFLGPDGAAKMINAATSQPGANAAAMFPQAAAANPSIFYDSAGRARSANAVYAKLTGRFETARALNFPPSLRSTDSPPTSMAAAATSPVAPAAPSAPDTAGFTQAFADATVSLLPPPPPASANRSLFQSMFSDPARKAVTQTVSSLWTPARNTNDPARPLDLFTDTAPNVGKLFGGETG